MADADTSGARRPARAHRGDDAGLGVHSPVPHALHPTAQKILAAARKILTERGYQGMTLQAISAEAQVNKAGVWYYFGGKQQLVLAVLEDVFVRESLHFGTMPPADASLAARVDLIIGSTRQIRDRVRRFRAFYELLPEAARDAELHRPPQGLLPDLVRVGPGGPRAGRRAGGRRHPAGRGARAVRLGPARRHHRADDRRGARVRAGDGAGPRAPLPPAGGGVAPLRVRRPARAPTRGRRRPLWG